MIKKLLHFICFLVAGLLWSILLLVVARELCMLINRIDIFSPLTYHRLSAYWNGGGVLHAKDILMIFGMSLYVPICLYGLYKLYHYQYMRLLTVPLNFLSNLGMGDYRAPDVNIKNLKIEFTLPNCSDKDKADFRRYIENSVMPYLTQMIPSTSILSIDFLS